ncbi:MAG TPA: hypothetical protein VIM17_10080 [Jatrophihabitantaceae bacterium]|jgi:hypothetical protein
MIATDITAVPLTVEEESRLSELETIVTASMDTFVAVGNALVEISESKLYRATHSTFDAYVSDRFGIGRAYAYRKIEAAKVAAIVSPIGDTPNEAQARELSGLNDEQTRSVWQQAVAETAGRPTAKAVREARRTIVPKPASKVSTDRVAAIAAAADGVVHDVQAYLAMGRPAIVMLSELTIMIEEKHAQDEVMALALEQAMGPALDILRAATIAQVITWYREGENIVGGETA